MRLLMRKNPKPTSMKLITLLASILLSTIAIAQPTAAITCTVTDFKGNVRKGETVYFVGQKTKKKFETVSDAKGIALVNLPKGDIYEIQLLGIGEEKEYSTLEIPNQEGEMTAKVKIQFELPLTVDLNDINFETGKSNLKPTSFKQLDKLVLLMERKPEMTIQIIGHTDNVGNNEANLQLSKDRAASVKKYIIAKGIAAKRIETDGKGAYEPIADNNTEKGKAQNRRTEIRVKE